MPFHEVGSGGLADDGVAPLIGARGHEAGPRVEHAAERALLPRSHCVEEVVDDLEHGVAVRLPVRRERREHEANRQH